MYHSNLGSDPEMEQQRSEANKKHTKIKNNNKSLPNTVLSMIPKRQKALWDLIMLLCYLSVSGAGVALQMTKITSGVLQTEACLVSLRHLTASADLKQIIMAELIHAVVVPGRKKKEEKEC